jgi:hypothetical protein
MSDDTKHENARGISELSNRGGGRRLGSYEPRPDAEPESHAPRPGSTELPVETVFRLT